MCLEDGWWGRRWVRVGSLAYIKEERFRLGGKRLIYGKGLPGGAGV